MDIVILIVSILLLGFLCLKNVPTLVGGILCSVLLLLFYGMDLYTGLLDTYMSGFVDFTKTWFLMFLLGALFGKVMDVSGAADSLARAVLNLVGEKRISLGVFIISALFITCGISVYITLFICLPIAIKMCRRANLSRGFIIAGYSLGINTGLALPYVAATNNMLCTDYFGTTAAAGGILAVAVTVVYAVVGMIYINWYEKRMRAKGLGYVPAEGEGALAEVDDDETRKLPHWILAVIPMIVPIIVLNVFSAKVETSLLIGVACAVVLQFKYLPRKLEPIRKMMTDSLSTTTLTIVNTSAIVGFGFVLQATPGYSIAVEQILGINAHPLIVALVSVNLIAGIAGASSAGLVLAAPVLQQLLPLTNAEVFHRTVVLSSLGLDSLPNAGFLQTECTLAGVKFKDVYLPIIFMETVVMTLLRALLYIGLTIAFGMA